MLKRLLVVGIVALMSGVSARLLTASRPAVADPFPSDFAPNLNYSAKLRWEPVWQRPARNWVSAGFAPDSTTLAWVDDQGSIRRMENATGKTLWQTSPFRGINRVSVASSGSVIAYSGLNPAKPGIRLLDARYGDRKSIMVPVEGAVWNAVVAPGSNGGEQVFITTGERLLYAMPLHSDVTWPGTPAKLPGIAETVDVAVSSNKTPELLLGTWQDGGIGIWGGDRLPRWRQQERDLRRSYHVALSGDGNTAVAISGIGREGEQALLHAWNARTGKLLWIEKLHGDDARVAISDDGQRIVVTYRRSNNEAGQSSRPAVQNDMPGRKVVLFDRSARRLFGGLSGEKGGSFFAPELLCLSPDGNRITVQNDQDIVTLDGRGNRIARLHLEAVPGKSTPRVLHVLPSPDASSLLVITGDGLMTLYKAN